MAIAHGWSARQAVSFVTPPPVPGNRVVLYGQNAMFEEGFVNWGGDNEDIAVDHAKWLMGGQSSGVVWVSDIAVDLSLWTPGATAVNEVGATVRSALTTAGFTISASSTSTDKITYPAFDIAIVGFSANFATDLTNALKMDMLYDYIIAGGALMCVLSSEAYMTSGFITKDPIFLGHSGPIANTGEELGLLTNATAQNSILFPPGRRMHRKISNYVGVHTIDSDSDHQEYAIDTKADPFNQFATFSGHGDA